MNAKQRAKKDKKAKEQAEAAKRKASLMQPVTAHQAAEKARDEQDNPKPLHRASRWLQFKDWVGDVTFVEVVNILLSLAIAGATSYYAVYAARQWGVMRDSIQLERPWLGPSGTVVRTFGPTQPPQGQQIDWSILLEWKLEFKMAVERQPRGSGGTCFLN